jgi:uncharacterized protein (TIGR02996 family)
VTVAAADPLAAAFLADIVAHPEEDAPRLIYADWLDEHGQPDRAEFIRLQCRLARPDVADVRYAAVRARAGDLFRGAWDAEVVSQHWPGSFAWPASVYRRGFVAEVTLPCSAWLRHGPALVRAAPLQVVRLSDREPGENGSATVFFWRRWTEPLPAFPSDVPDAIFRLLEPVTVNHFATFPSRDAALDALSVSCLAFAREKAGLPALPPTPAGAVTA